MKDGAGMVGPWARLGGRSFDEALMVYTLGREHCCGYLLWNMCDTEHEGTGWTAFEATWEEFAD